MRVKMSNCDITHSKDHNLILYTCFHIDQPGKKPHSNCLAIASKCDYLFGTWSISLEVVDLCSQIYKPHNHY